jgi:hypothetical protein
MWHELAADVKEDALPVSLAKIDGTTNPNLLSRFNIKGYPTLIYLHNGMMYEYDDRRDLQSLKSFVNGGYTAVKSVKVPSPDTLRLQVQRQLNELWSELKYMVLTKPVASSIIFNSGLFGGIIFSNFLTRTLSPSVTGTAQISSSSSPAAAASGASKLPRAATPRGGSRKKR